MVLGVWAGFDEPTNRRTVRVGATTDSRYHVLVISLSVFICFLYGLVPIFSFFHFAVILYVITSFPLGFIAVGLTAAAVLIQWSGGSFESSSFPPASIVHGRYRCREITVRTQGPQL